MAKKFKIVDSSPPFYDPFRDGVTYSILASFAECREKTRLSLKGHTSNRSSFSLVFGGITHWLIEQIYLEVQKKRLTKPPSSPVIRTKLDQLTSIWKTENPFPDPDTIEHFELTMAILEPLMGLYFKHWKADFEREWTKLEHEFKIPLKINSPLLGEVTVPIRGKMDGAFQVSSKKRLRLFETKTKSRMDEGNLVDILPFELQINIYMWALRRLEKRRPVGVLYNIIRRPGLRPRKGELFPQFAERIVHDIKARPDWYFVRMEMDVTERELDKFEGELIDLVTDFIHWWKGKSGHWKNSNFCENKYGVCWALGICSRQDFHGTFVRERVFRELSGDV